MNKIYRVVFNKSTQTWTAVAEFARAKGKSGSATVGSVETTNTVGKLLGFNLIMSGLILSGQAMAVTGAEQQLTDATGNVCYFDTKTKSVVCGDATSSVTKLGNSAVAVGVGATASNSNDVMIGNKAGLGFDDKGSDFYGSGNVYFANGTTQATSIATGENIAIGPNAGLNASGRKNIVVGRDAGTQHFGEDSVTIGTNANNFSGAKKNYDNTALAAGDTYRARRTVAIGNSAMTYGEQSIAIGSGANTKPSAFESGTKYTTASNAIAIGVNARASGNDTVAQGTNSVAEGNFDIVIGTGANRYLNPNVTSGISGVNSQSIAMGLRAKVGPVATKNAMAIGTDTKVLAGNNSIALGAESQTIGNNLNVALGVGNKTAGDRANAIGNSNTAFGYDTSAIGSQAHVMMAYGTNGRSSDNGVAVGAAAIAGNRYSAAIGNAVAVFGQNSGAFSASSSGPNADEAFKQGDTSKQNALGTVTIVGGQNNFAIGNSNVVGSTSQNNMVLGNRVTVGATSATMSNPVTVYRLALRDTATGVTTVTSTAYIKDGNNYFAYTDNAANGHKGAQLDLTGKTVSDAVAFKQVVPVFNNTKAVNRSVAIGQAASVADNDSIAIGTNSVAGDVAKVANATMNAIAIGNGAQATGLQSISIGTGNQVSGTNAGALGDPSIVSGAGSYTVGNDNAVGSTSTNVGAFGNSNQIGATATYDIAGKLLTANGLTDTAAVSGSRVVGNYNTVTTNDTFVMGNYVFNTADNSVFLGTGSGYLDQGTRTDGLAAVTEPVTVGGLTYGDFEGKTPVGVVSVGDWGSERRIQNMAAGLISATSTDAINGSQLYATNEKLGNVAATVVQNFGGNAALNPDGSITYTNIGGTGQDNINDAISSVKTYVVAGTNVVVDEHPVGNANGTTYTVNAWDTTVSAAADSAVTVTPTIDEKARTRAYEVTVNTDGTTVEVKDGKLSAVTSDITTDGNGVATATTPTSLATAGDVAEAINASGFNVIGAGNNAGGAFANELINPGDTVTLEAGKNLTVAQTGGKFVFATADDVEFNNVTVNDTLTVGPVTINQTGIDAGNTKITNVEAGTADTDAVNVSQLKDAQAAATTKVEGDQGVIVTPKPNADGSTTYTVAAKTDGTTVKVDGNGNIAAVTSDITTDGNGVATATTPTSLATAGDVAEAINASGWKLAADGTTGTELINPSDTVTFKAGSDNLTVKREGADITYDLARDINVDSVQVGADGPKITNDGDNIKIGDKDGNATSITNITSGLTAKDVATAPTGTGSTGTSPIVDLTNANVVDNTAATVGDLRNMGWVVSATGNDYVDTVKNANQVDFVGTGLATVTGETKDGVRTITVDVNAQSTVESAQTPVVYTNKDGEKVYKQADGSFNTKPDGTGTAVAPADVIASMNDGSNSTTAPMVLANVASTLPSTSSLDTTDENNAPVAPTNAAPITAEEAAELANTAGNNAATVSDVLNAGWNLQTNGEATDFVKPYDTVNFVNGAGTTVVSTTDGATSSIRVNTLVAVTDKDGNTLVQANDGNWYKADDVVNGEPVADATPVDAADTQVNVINPAAPANTKGEAVQLGNIASNLPSTYNTDEYNTAGEPVTTTQALPTGLNVNNAATVGDILNSGWNLQGNGAAKDFVKPYDTVNFVDGNATTATVTTSADGKSSEVKYDVKVDGSTIAIQDGKLTVIAPDADTITTVTAGDNIEVTNTGTTDAPNYQVATKKDVKFNSVEVGPVTINQDGINAGDTKITNVADGEVTADSKDAVNGSQLYNVVNNLNSNIAAAKTIVEGDQGVKVESDKNADGSTTFTVSAKTDGTTVNVDSNGNIAAVTGDITTDDSGVATVTTPSALATAGDVATAINDSGFTLTAQGAEGSLVKPGSTVDMNNTDGNIVISKSSKNNNVTYNLAKDVKVDSVTTGNTVVNNDGITIKAPTTSDANNTVSLTNNGLNNGGNRVTNVAAGKNATDAVNVSQLNQVRDNVKNLDNKINRSNREARAGIAGANTAAALPQVYIPGKSMIAASAGTFKGESALAVGYSRASDNGKVILKLQGNANTQGDVGAAVGVGYQW